MFWTRIKLLFELDELESMEEYKQLYYYIVHYTNVFLIVNWTDRKRLGMKVMKGDAVLKNEWNVDNEAF